MKYLTLVAIFCILAPELQEKELTDIARKATYMQTSPVGINLIQSFEKFRSEAYRDSVGVWTIGWGSTRIFGRKVVKYDSITRQQADRQFQFDLEMFEKHIKSYVRGGIGLNQNQFDALVSLCYNIGQGNLKNSSVIRYINDGMMVSAGNSFLLWDKARHRRTGKLKRLRGLTRRRNAERELFLSDDDGIGRILSDNYIEFLKPRMIEKLVTNWQKRKYEIAKIANC